MVVGRKANPLATLTMDELRDGMPFAVLNDGGQMVGAYVLRGQGGEVWIQAAAGTAEIDLCDVFDDLIAKHGAGFETVAFRTYRRGLVKKSQDRGYQVAGYSDGYTMRKKLK